MKLTHNTHTHTQMHIYMYCSEIAVARASAHAHRWEPCPFIVRSFYCRHRPRGGCQWVGELGEVEKHLNGTEGCLYVRVACQQCKKMFLKCNLELHISKTCPMTPVVCEVEEYGCNVKIPRRAMARHMEHNHAVHLIKKCKDKMESLSENRPSSNRKAALCNGTTKEGGGDNWIISDNWFDNWLCCDISLRSVYKMTNFC